MLRLLIFLISLGARAIRAMCRRRADLVIENLALRQQGATLKKERPRPALDDSDRAFWVALRTSWPRMESAMAGHYVYNNISIAFRCFALGIFLGLGTVYVLVFNGIALGTFAGYVIAQGHGENFLSFVVSHGSFELTAIVISGAAGLILGHGIVAPGRLSRSQSLRRRGLVAVQLVMGAGAMLAVAALIEAFWSPSPLHPMVKYIGGGVLWMVVFAYLAFAGRNTRSEKEPAQA
jgi:uncharacterized membrane protein SpoIIM required for sporulation